MALATTALNKQKRAYASYIWGGLALAAVGGYAGIKIMKDGMGTSVQTGGGANVWLRKLMSWLTERGINAEQLLPVFMVALFFIIAIIGIFKLVRGVRLMNPAKTMLGKSILTQRQGSESLSELIDSINADLEQEPCVFGSVYIGRKWILDIEAMRVAAIRGVFWFDEGMEDHVLCCVDEAQNIWAASLRYGNDRDKAAEYLKKTLPDITSGDKDAYILFLGGKADADEESPAGESADADKTAAPPVLSPTASLSFVGAQGIPTSNFTYEAAREALRALRGSQSVALRVLKSGGSTVSEVSFTRTGEEWSVCVAYRYDDEDLRVVNTVTQSMAERILEDLINQKRLPQIVA